MLSYALLLTGLPRLSHARQFAKSYKLSFSSYTGNMHSVHHLKYIVYRGFMTQISLFTLMNVPDAEANHMWENCCKHSRISEEY